MNDDVTKLNLPKKRRARMSDGMMRSRRRPPSCGTDMHHAWAGDSSALYREVDVNIISESRERERERERESGSLYYCRPVVEKHGRYIREISSCRMEKQHSCAVLCILSQTEKSAFALRQECQEERSNSSMVSDCFSWHA